MHGVRALAKPVMNTDTIQSKLDARATHHRHVLLRTVIAPVREEEVVDVVELGRKEFRDRLVQLGMQDDIELFSRWHQKKATFRHDTLGIEQHDGDEPPYRHVALEVDSRGVLVMDGNVTDRTERDSNFGFSSMQIVHADVEEALREQLAFAHAFFEQEDPYERQHAVLYNCALLGAEYRPLMQGPITRGSVQMPIRPNGPVVAHQLPRQVGRAALRSPDSEIERTMTMFGRRMNN